MITNTSGSKGYKGFEYLDVLSNMLVTMTAGMESSKDQFMFFLKPVEQLED